jgi:hypothetical protein
LALGHRSRIQQIAPSASGAIIYEAVQGEGSISARLFLDWWLSEDVFINLKNFMEAEFGHRAQLLERSGAQSCRYRIRKIDFDDEQSHSKASISPRSPRGAKSEGREWNALSEIFAKIEGGKASLHVAEYSVGQTTLEQIFNQFASQQDNPEVAMALSAEGSSFPSALPPHYYDRNITSPLVSIDQSSNL